jgi:hypothetical protein
MTDILDKTTTDDEKMHAQFFQVLLKADTI